jgi:adenosylhomocysteine nucleosidase
LSHFSSDIHLSTQLAGAANEFLENDFMEAIGQLERKDFGLAKPKLHRGLIGSGDQFVSSRYHLTQLNSSLSGLLAVEMGGAAVAQVCFELGVPFAVIRTISDNANEDAATDFMRFVKTVAARYAFHIVRRFCSNLNQPSMLSAGT